MEPKLEILLVEDNPNDVELAMRAFSKRGLDKHIAVVSDGAEALDFLFASGSYSSRNPNHLPHIIFLDINLPKIDGFEVLRRVKENQRTRMIPVVMLTSSREDSDVVKSYQNGASSYVVKPIDYDLFIESVVELAKYWIELNQAPMLMTAQNRTTN
ncbi:MAG TPA: response regulator [Bacteroidota bacterium]|nr:response regulator [Bacteroidota bacterium]